MKIIIGLGNPGEQYKNTRHNIAWLYFDYLLGAVKWSENKKWNALIYETVDALYVKPLSFMNNSGQVVQKILNYYKLLPKNFGLLTKRGADLTNELIVVHDDLDIPFGKYKIASDSSSAGHRGVESIINYLKTKNFYRFRLGIANNLLRNPIPPEKFVLQKFSREENGKLGEIFSQISIKI